MSLVSAVWITSGAINSATYKFSNGYNIVVAYFPDKETNFVVSF